MEFPTGLRYSQEHEWVAVDGDVATIGITDYAQEQLGDVVYVELPAAGKVLNKDDTFGVVESVKAVSDIYAPVSGAVTETNADLHQLLLRDCGRRQRSRAVGRCCGWAVSSTDPGYAVQDAIRDAVRGV